MNIPNYFSNREDILNFDHSIIDQYVNSNIDNSFYIPNLSPNKDKSKLCSDTFKNVLLGNNHIYIQKILKSLNNPSAKIMNYLLII